MNLEEKIDLIKDAKDNIKQAIIDKGVTPEGNISTYAEAIEDIVTPNNQDITITSNGTYTCDEGYTGIGTVTANFQEPMNYVSVDSVEYMAIPLGTSQITGTIPIKGRGADTLNNVRVMPMASGTSKASFGCVENINGASTMSGYGTNNGTLQTLEFPKLREVRGNNAFALAFQDCSSLHAVDFSSLQYISGSSVMNSIFYQSGLNGALNLSKLNAIDGSRALYQAFASTGITSVNLSRLTTITSGSEALGSTFSGCTRLQEVDLSNLRSIDGTYAFNNTFSDCNSLKSISLPKLTSIPSNTFLNTFRGLPQLKTANFSVVGSIGAYGMKWAFQSSSLESASFPNLLGVDTDGLYETFASCTKLVSVDFSKLTTANFHGTFIGCTSLESIDFPRLRQLTGNAFENAFGGCSKLTSTGLSTIESIVNNSNFHNTFLNCKALTTISFDSLRTLTGSSNFEQAFKGCTALQSISFPYLMTFSGSNQFKNMLQGVTGCTVHFPSRLESTLSQDADVIAGFGGTDTTVLFDL